MKDKETLKEEFEYFLANKDALVEEHLGKFVAIKNQSVIGVYQTEADAIIDTVQGYGLGNVLIQQCLPGEESYSQYFHSRVVF